MRQPGLLGISVAWCIGHAPAVHGYAVCRSCFWGRYGICRCCHRDRKRGDWRDRNRDGCCLSAGECPSPRRGLRPGASHEPGSLCFYAHQRSDARKSCFFVCNELLATISEAVVIVQAGERGGSAATARSAVSHGKKLLLLPSVAENTSWGRNYVSGGKAAIARNVSEMISALEAHKSRDRLVV